VKLVMRVLSVRQTSVLVCVVLMAVALPVQMELPLAYVITNTMDLIVKTISAMGTV